MSLIDTDRWAWGVRAKEAKQRDGYSCVSCGSMVRLEVDHIVPRRLGGSDDLSNLRTLCHDCHVNRYEKPISTRRGPFGRPTRSIFSPRPKVW